MTTGKIGFCCKWYSESGDNQAESLMNYTTTTLKSLAKLSDYAMVEKLFSIVQHNLDATKNLVTWTSQQPEHARLLRLGSDLLPMYTHEVANWAYQEPVMREIIENGFAEIGDLARLHDVRMSFHPCQFCVLNSTCDIVQQRAVDDLEYHTEMMRWMGYTGAWHAHGAAINIHAGGREGGIRRLLAGFKLLSEDAKNLLTIENDEVCFGLTDLAPIADKIAIVLDIHHEWVYSKGKHIKPTDKRIQYVKDSWRGVRPLGHYSAPGSNLIAGVPENKLPSFKQYREAGLSLRDIRTHSDTLWNQAANDWALSHLSWMDIEVEAKKKNLAANQLISRAIKTGMLKP